MIVIGITGTNGAGKGTVVEYLIKKKGFVHYSVRDYLINKINEKKLPINRESMVLVANKLREEFGPSFIVEQLYEKALKTGNNCIIESIRTPGEAEFLKNKTSFVLLAVDAESKIRYERIKSRNSETDQITYKKFKETEDAEMRNADAFKQNLAACIAMADYKINNDSTVEDLYQKAEEIITKISALKA